VPSAQPGHGDQRSATVAAARSSRKGEGQDEAEAIVSPPYGFGRHKATQPGTTCRVDHARPLSSASTDIQRADRAADLFSIIAARVNRGRPIPGRSRHQGEEEAARFLTARVRHSGEDVRHAWAKSIGGERGKTLASSSQTRRDLETPPHPGQCPHAQQNKLEELAQSYLRSKLCVSSPAASTWWPSSSTTRAASRPSVTSPTRFRRGW